MAASTAATTSSAAPSQMRTRTVLTARVYSYRGRGFADASNKRGRGPTGLRSAVGCGSCALESYSQQMKDQDERPSQYSEDGTNDHGDYVDGDVVREEQIRQKEED